jgi:hypothetical protein
MSGSGVHIGAVGARESVDYLEDLFALGSGNTADYHVDSRYQISK